jgi:hypothetical protein
MPKRWAKHENKELHTLSAWVKSIRGILKSRIRNIRTKVRTTYPSVFSKPELINALERLHEEFVLVPADKACDNIVFVCKAHYYNCISNELDIKSIFGNLTYTLTALSKDEILQNHRSVVDTFNIQIHGMNGFEFPYLYWIPNLYKTPYKHRYIAGSSKCSTKPLSMLLTNILIAVKEKHQTYCVTAYARSGVNQMWILKNSQELLKI